MPVQTHQLPNINDALLLDLPSFRVESAPGSVLKAFFGHREAINMSEILLPGFYGHNIVVNKNGKASMDPVLGFCSRKWIDSADRNLVHGKYEHRSTLLTKFGLGNLDELGSELSLVHITGSKFVMLGKGSLYLYNVENSDFKLLKTISIPEKCGFTACCDSSDNPDELALSFFGYDNLYIETITWSDLSAKPTIHISECPQPYQFEKAYGFEAITMNKHFIAVATGRSICIISRHDFAVLGWLRLPSSSNFGYSTIQFISESKLIVGIDTCVFLVDLESDIEPAQKSLINGFFFDPDSELGLKKVSLDDGVINSVSKTLGCDSKRSLASRSVQFQPNLRCQIWYDTMNHTGKEPSSLLSRLLSSPIPTTNHFNGFQWAHSSREISTAPSLTFVISDQLTFQNHFFLFAFPFPKQRLRQSQARSTHCFGEQQSQRAK